MILNETPEVDVCLILLAESRNLLPVILCTKEKPAIYAVVAVGPGTKDVTMTVKPGDKVVIATFVGSDIKLDGVEYKFVKQDEILAIVE